MCSIFNKKWYSNEYYGGTHHAFKDGGEAFYMLMIKL